MMKKFRKKIDPVLPPSPTTFPDGTCVVTETGAFYIKGGMRLRILSQRIMDSWAFPRIVKTDESKLGGMKIFGRLGFRDGTLLTNMADGRMYLVSGNRIRHLTSPDILDGLGAAGEDFILVSQDEINIMKEGDPL